MNNAHTYIIDKNWMAYEKDMIKEHIPLTDEFQHMQLFRAGLQTGLAAMSESKFVNEKHMQKLVEDNIETLFPGLKFLKTEFRDMVEGERRPDTIAFDTNQNTFVVIEYKNRRNSDVVAQANTYLRDMEQNKAALVLEHSTKMNCKPLDKKLFCWKDMYAIIMAPEFGPFQISGASKNQEVEMYETRMYDNLVITVERVGGGHIRKGSHGGRQKPSQHGHGVHVSKDNASLLKLYETIHERLLDAFLGMTVNKKPKNYDGFRLPNSREYFCTTRMRKQKILLFLARHVKLEQNAPGFVISNNRLDIRDEADFGNALIILKRLHRDWPRYKRDGYLTY